MLRCTGARPIYYGCVRFALAFLSMLVTGCTYGSNEPVPVTTCNVTAAIPGQTRVDIWLDEQLADANVVLVDRGYTPARLVTSGSFTGDAASLALPMMTAGVSEIAVIVAGDDVACETTVEHVFY